MSDSGAGVLWESIGEDPMVRDLAARLARRSGERRPEKFLASLGQLARDISLPGVLTVARESVNEHELELSVVKNRVRAYANNHTPSWAFCTGGMTSIEISPNGFYGRCPKTGAKQIYLGDLREEGPLRVLDLASDDLSCTMKCAQFMCFTHNVVRGTDQADFARKIDQKGVRGGYRADLRNYHSKIFIRWKVTDVCNYTCAYCTDWKTVNKKGVELTDAEMMVAAKKIVSQFGSISMRLTGGEPSSRRCYVDLMRLFHDNLDLFTDIEIRTNLSYQAKHKEVLSWDWNGKLHLNVGCHIRDKNFMPWRTVELLRDAPDADYVLKFVTTPTMRHHVMFFRQYFVDSGIPPQNIRVIEEVGKDAHSTEPEEAPRARKALEERVAAVAPATDAPPSARAEQAGVNGVSSGAVKRFTLADLRARTGQKPEHHANRLDVLADEQKEHRDDCAGKKTGYLPTPPAFTTPPS